MGVRPGFNVNWGLFSFSNIQVIFFKVLNILNLMYFILLPCNLKQGPWFLSVKFSL